jgi:hypothetical protein
MTPNFIEILVDYIVEASWWSLVYGDKLLFSGQGNSASTPIRFEPIGDRMGKLLANLFANNVNPLL